MLPVTIEEQKRIAKKHFDEKTDEYGLVHTFDFEEVWQLMLSQRYRNNIMKVQEELAKQPAIFTEQEDVDKLNPLKHMFADGLYIREIFNPAGEIIVTKIHKVNHPFFLLEGKMSITTENGPIVVEAPHYGITRAGTKRVIFAHTDCKFVTVHATDKTDVKEIEEEVIAKDFKELDDYYLQTEESFRKLTV